MADPRFVVVKTGSTVPALRERRGDFEVWIADGLGCGPADLDVVSVYEGDPLPDVAAGTAVVVTGSPAFVSERDPWSLRTEQWLVPLVEREVPLLGICYGHQLLAQALGGEVGPNPRGRSIGTVEVDLRRAAAREDELLGALPQPAALHVTHIESVLRLPEGAVLLGESPTDPHHAFAVGPRAWGVQFHPEFDADIVRGYATAREDDLRAEGISPEVVTAGIRETPHGRSVLRRFAEIAGEAGPR